MMEDEIALLARMAGLAIDPAHLPGVTRNMAILLAQAASLAEVPVDAMVEPATVFRP